jgi:drug/metabolite transporter (DMT)-like permease
MMGLCIGKKESMQLQQSIGQPIWQRGALAVLTSLLFAGSFVAGKYATAELGPLSITLFRYLIAFAVLQGLVLWFGCDLSLRHRLPNHELGNIKGTLNWRHIGTLFLTGTVGVVGYHFFFFLALRYTATTNTAIINAFNPVVTGFLALLFLRERLNWRNYGGGVLAILGVLLLLTQGNLVKLLHLDLNQGDLLMVCAVLCWAVYANLLRYLGRTYSGLTMSYYSALFGVLQLLVLSAPDLVSMTLPSWPAILGIVYMGVGASGIGYLLFTLSTQRIGPTRSTSIVYSGVPIWVALLAWLFFRESVTPWMLVSIALILVGLRTVLQPHQENAHSA